MDAGSTPATSTINTIIYHEIHETNEKHYYCSFCTIRDYSRRMKKLIGLIKLMRFELPLSAGVCVVLGQVLAQCKFASFLVMLNGFLSIFFISAAILVMNDIIDLETDKINAPERPLPSKQVTPAQSIIFAIFLLTAGLILSSLISINALLISIVLAIIGFLYNRYFMKHGLIGNLMVSFSVGMTFIYGGASVGMPFNKTVLFFALISALVDLGEEIAADAMDMEGDKLINSKSLAIKYGKSTARKVSTGIFSLVVLLSAIPFIFKWFSLIYLIPIVIMDFFIAYSTLKLLKAPKESERVYIRMIYLGATFGLVVFLVMRLAGL